MRHKNVQDRGHKVDSKMKKSDFVHLHVHSEFSLLDGASRVEDIVGKAKKMGMDAVAVTDHGNMYSAIKFYLSAKEAGIHPIIGCEGYLAPKSRFDKSTKEDRSPSHITLLAKNNEGYKNLLQLVTLSNTEGFYQKPRVDKELLQKYRNGLVVMSGCLAGEIPRFIMAGEHDKANSAAIELKDIFGEDFYLEVMDNDLPEQKPVTERLIEMSKKLDIRLVATNDSHYTNKEDAQAQDTLLCIQTGRFLDDENRMRFGSNEFYLKSGEEMKALFSGIEEAITSTVEIKEKCNVSIETGKSHFPDFPVPEGMTHFTYLKKLANDGIRKRYGDDLPERVKERLKHELAVIEKMEYAPFFLVVQDFINYAKSKGIEVGPGRGSAAGSIVAYALNVTDIDPLEYNLLFERFLNAERVTMPDIDTDFCCERRQEVIDYVVQKYGTDHVGQIITFGTMKARAAIRDVGRVQRVSLTTVDKIAKMIPAMGPNATIDGALSTVPELKSAYNSDASIKKVIDTARMLEGLTRHASVHAAGVVISQKPLTEYTPVQIMNETQKVVQYSMKDLDKIGLLKMDFLGLSNLTMIAHAVRLIKKTKNVSIDVRKLPLDNQDTYELLSRGETMGIFQLESQGMRALIKNLKPNKFEDIIALLALYRPGPLESGMVDDFIKRKSGLKKLEYSLKELEPILEETYGVILYQEQVMEIASTIAGFSMGEADILRYAMGKKNPKEMAKQNEKFVKGAVKKGFSEKKAKSLFDLIEKFAGYGFNKSHSTAYAMISYETAYLKACYPIEFMAALMTSVMGDSDKVALYISESQRMDIPVLSPDINESGRDFTPVKDSIRFGLAAIKNVGYGAVDSIIETREKNGSFASFKDFCGRIDLRVVNKKVVESLIKCGAFDSFNISRAGLLSRYEEIISRSGKSPKNNINQINLFGETDVTSYEDSSISEEEIPEFTKDQLLKMEKEMLGLYISDHPLSHLKEQLELRTNAKIADLNEKDKGTSFRLGGVLKNSRKVTTKKNDLMMIAVLEDLTGTVPVVFFPEVYKKNAMLLSEDLALIVKGKLDIRNDELQIICEDVEAIESEKARRTLHVNLKPGMNMDELLRIKSVLTMYRGGDSAMIHIDGKIISTSESYQVIATPVLVEAIDQIAGQGSAWVEMGENGEDKEHVRF